MPDNEKLLEQAELLIHRLERLSADSIWARRASGLRGSLLHWLDQVNLRGDNPGEADWLRLADLVQRGFSMLTAAAREIPIPSERR
jgi:hypothetical protein